MVAASFSLRFHKAQAKACGYPKSIAQNLQLIKSHKSNKDTELRYLLLLLNNTDLIFRLSKKLFDFFPNIEELFSADVDLARLGLSSDEISKLRNPDWRVVEQDLCWAEQAKHHIITINNPEYPELLKEIQNPPLIFFVAGDLQLLKTSQIAVIGSRNPTPIGVETAFNFSRELARAGLVITSGLAIGIDAAGHRGAIAASAKTIAVMGTGLNRVYPSHHVKLAEEIIDTGGVLLSEFPRASSGKAWHFPLRNRIISGLSMGTLVVEATMRSGSLITARLASEQGREVFAIPGSIYNSKAQGCHYLIRQGAKLVDQPMDVLEEFPEFIKVIKSQNIADKKGGEKNKLDCKHKKLLDCMGFEIATVDALVARIDLPASQVVIMLLELELQGSIKTVMGGYIRILNM